MKKITLMVLMMAIAITAGATTQSRKSTPIAPQGNLMQLDENMLMRKSPVVLESNELVTPPASATIETNWELSGDYISGQNFFKNKNEIAVAFADNEIYVQGLVYTCPESWIKGVIDGSTVTFANGQFVGNYELEGSVYDVFVCGSTDGETLSDIVFEYTGNKLVIKNIYIENTSTTGLAYFFYSNYLTLTKNSVTPTIAEVTPTATTAEVSWEDGNNATQWNLRYHKFVECETILFEDFEGNGEELPEGWTTIDADGDGNTWFVFVTDDPIDSKGNPTNFDSSTATSASYDNNTGVLHPDNWLITPQVDLGGVMSVWMRGQDPSWAGEHFAIYLSTTGNNVEDFTTILVEETISESVLTEYTADLSQYANQKGYIAIRHYNVSDMFRLNVDNFLLTDVAPEPWTVLEGITENPYTITGLEPTTDYEVQVQSVMPPTRAEDAMMSDWSESVVFTTLEEYSGVDNITRDTPVGDNHYYNLLGQKLAGNRLPAGIYIHNGKKVIVK